MKTRGRGTDQFFTDFRGARYRSKSCRRRGTVLSGIHTPGSQGLLKDTVVFSQYKFECPSRPSQGGRADLMVLPRIKKPYHQGHGRWYGGSAASYIIQPNWKFGKLTTLKLHLITNSEKKLSELFTFII